MKNIITLIALLLIATIGSQEMYAQRTCGAMDDLAEQLLNDPTIQNRMEAIEEHTRQVINSGNRSVAEVYTIPVVFHIVYHTEDENVSDEQVLSQLEVMNDDFRRLNADADNTWSQASDVEIEFCLAENDPLGRATCGITRTYTEETSFPKLNNPVKFDSEGGVDAWPAEDYLNIWVCQLDGLLGYAQFPGLPAETDGIVVDYWSFGTIGDLHPDFNLGRTTTHEIGHWLNLRHIWGDGDCFDDDFVSDTPVSDDHNYNCDIGHISCGSVDMVQNYMDYSDDFCMNLFTTGQKNRMRALFNSGGARESLLNSTACDIVSCSDVTLIITFDSYPADISWELRDGSGVIIAYDENYTVPPGSVLEYQFCLGDGPYIFEINDSYGDGLCCNEGEGGYELASLTEIYYTSDGQFQSGETINFDVAEFTYIFQGPGTDWNDPSNWSNGIVPSDCVRGDVFIESNCNANGAKPLNPDALVTVRNNATLTFD